MIHDTDTVARDTIALSKKILEEMRAEAIIMGCTIVAGCYQRYLMRTGETGGVTIVNPNLLALKMAEGLPICIRKVPTRCRGSASTKSQAVTIANSS
jgi:allantoin racemase